MNASVTMSKPQALGPVEERFERFVEEFVREDEFTCRGCEMIVHRSRLADRAGMRCAACVSIERLPGGGGGSTRDRR